MPGFGAFGQLEFGAAALAASPLATPTQAQALVVTRTKSAERLAGISNLVPRPSFETGAAGWSVAAGSGATLVSSAVDGSWATDGASSYRIRATINVTGTTGYAWLYRGGNAATRMPVSGGASYFIQVDVNVYQASVSAPHIELRVYWYEADGTQLPVTRVGSAASGPQTLSVLMPAPATATSALVAVYSNGVAGDTIEFACDSFLFVQSPIPLAFFSGDRPGAPALTSFLGGQAATLVRTQAASAVRAGDLAGSRSLTQAAAPGRRVAMSAARACTESASASYRAALARAYAGAQSSSATRSGLARGYALTQASARSRSGALSRTWPSAQLASPAHRQALSYRATVAQSAAAASMAGRPGSVRLVSQVALVERPATRYLAFAQAASATRSRALARRLASTGASAAWRGGGRGVPRTLAAAQTQVATRGKVKFVSLHIAGLAAARRGWASVARTHPAAQATGLIGHVSAVTFVVRFSQSQAVVEKPGRRLVGARVVVVVGRFKPLVSVERERRLLVEVS